MAQHLKTFAADDRIVVTADASEHQGKTGEIRLANEDGSIVKLDSGPTIYVESWAMARIGVR